MSDSKNDNKARGTALSEILDAIDEFILPDDLDIISARAREVKRRRQEDEINVGDEVVMSPTSSPTLHMLCGGTPSTVLAKTRDGLLVVDIGGSEGRLSRDKVLLSKRATNADKH